MPTNKTAFKADKVAVKKAVKADKTVIKKAVTINRTAVLVALSIVLLLVLYLLFKPSTPEKVLEQQAQKTQAEEIRIKGSGMIETEALSSEEEEKAEKRAKALFGVTKARFQLETTNNTDIIKVIAEGTVREGNTVTFKYEWTKNNEPAGETDSIKEFKRGDKLSVKITPFDGKEYGQSKTLSTEIKNTTPRVIEHAEIKIDNNLLAYQVKAFDPDGDPLAYSLIEAPEGMTIDETSGLIKWPVDPGSYGKKYGIKVKISDNHGGEVVYSLNLSL
jgi:hypothetical protein